MTTFPRGSEWRRWDLHVHSPLSILNNQFPHLPDHQGPDWEPYLAALEAAPVAVLGITDYFTIDGYKELKQRQAAGRLPNKLLLPNIEFRLDQFVSSKQDGGRPRRLELHVIFSDEVSVEDIEEHFLHDLDFVNQEDPGEAAEVLKLKNANLIRLGERLISEQPTFRGTPLEVGASNAVVRFKAILERLKSDRRFTNKYLLVLPADGWNDIPWGGQDHQARQLLLQGTDFVFASNAKTVQWCLGKPPYGEGAEKFQKEFRTLKPCLHGSDAHSLHEICHPCAKRGVAGHDCRSHTEVCQVNNCWIKADPTFEGLRQVLYECEDRVRIQAADPTPSKTQFCLSAVEIADSRVNAGLHFSGTKIPLNNGLVVVTGGRGSGKTALVDLIANCFVNRADGRDPNSFVGRVRDSAAPFTTTLTFAGGQAFSKDLIATHFVDESSVIYIAQGELERYIGAGSDLNEYVHSLIFESEEIRNSAASYDYSALSEQIVREQHLLDDLNDNIDDLEQQTTPAAIEELRRSEKHVRAEVEDFTARVLLAEAALAPEKIEAAETRQRALDDKKAKRDTLTQAKSAIHEASRFLATDFSRFLNLIRTVNAAIAPLGLGADLSLPSYADGTRLTAVGDGVDRELRAVLVEIEKLEGELRTLASEQKDHATLLNKKREAELKLGQIQLGATSLASAQAALATARGARSIALRNLLSLVLGQRTQYEEIIERFSAAKDAVLADLDFDAEIVADWSDFMRGAEDILDNRQVVVYGNSATQSVFATWSAGLAALPTKGADGLDVIVAETDQLAADLRDKLKRSKTIGSRSLYKLIYQSYLTVRPIVRYKKTSLDRLSMGQKATVLMKIYLAEGDAPIIIDSHDDHLDNESIMEELVGSIRQAKQYRQVIVASNNGNVVINSDAEQLIIARRDDGQIAYVSGSLENPEIREKALKVLEGGRVAFRKRQEKYRLGR